MINKGTRKGHKPVLECCLIQMQCSQNPGTEVKIDVVHQDKGDQAKSRLMLAGAGSWVRSAARRTRALSTRAQQVKRVSLRGDRGWPGGWDSKAGEHAEECDWRHAVALKGADPLARSTYLARNRGGAGSGAKAHRWNAPFLHFLDQLDTLKNSDNASHP
jgi:hypothetical protein